MNSKIKGRLYGQYLIYSSGIELLRFSFNIMTRILSITKKIQTHVLSLSNFNNVLMEQCRYSHLNSNIQLHEIFIKVLFYFIKSLYIIHIIN